MILYRFHFQKITEKVYLIRENWDQLSDLNIDFGYMFLDLIDIYSDYLLFENQILTFVIILHYLELINFQLEHKV